MFPETPKKNNVILLTSAAGGGGLYLSGIHHARPYLYAAGGVVLVNIFDKFASNFGVDFRGYTNGKAFLDVLKYTGGATAGLFFSGVSGWKPYVFMAGAMFLMGRYFGGSRDLPGTALFHNLFGRQQPNVAKGNVTSASGRY